MTWQEMHPCNGCKVRCIGCHGRKPDGTWRCTEWGIVQDALEEERRKANREHKGQKIAVEYIYDTKRRFERKRRSGHLGG